MKVGTRVRVDQPGGSEWESRFVGYSTIGLPQIATPCDRNPHCCVWPYTDKSLTPICDGEDWFLRSEFKIGQTVSFVFELEGFSGLEVGKTTQAVLVAPHIKPGDWVVDYQRHDNGGDITRCLNERQMLVPRSIDDKWLA